jgi:hypothetical protein
MKIKKGKEMKYIYSECVNRFIKVEELELFIG